MRPRMMCCVLAASAVMFTDVNAEKAAPAASIRVARAGDTTPMQRVRIPATNYEVRLDRRGKIPAAAPPSAELMQAVVTWLTANFALPAPAALPVVELVPPLAITTFRYTGELSDAPSDVAAIPKGQREVVATYDPLRRAIYLPERWSGATAAELSVLVHEMVHHLQYGGRLRYDCEAARETLAYAAQDKWLRLFGGNLARDFELDEFTLLVSTQCFR